jgi:hypothetical protein
MACTVEHSPSRRGVRKVNVDVLSLQYKFCSFYVVGKSGQTESGMTQLILVVNIKLTSTSPRSKSSFTTPGKLRDIINAV